MAYQQEGRLLKVDTPLGSDVLLLERFSGTEGISELFLFDLHMISENQNISAEKIIGKNITVELLLANNEVRYFNGFVRKFIAGQQKMQAVREYRAEVVPWFWFLRRKTDCRIFQRKNVKQIIQELFQENGFSDYDLSQIQVEHPEREYCVQYNESDFQFISRLMEEEGIFYWFRHENKKHILQAADHIGAPKKCFEYDISFTAGSMPLGHISGWKHQFKFTTGRWALNDYNYELPQTNLLSKEKSRITIPSSDKYEKFEYPGRYYKKNVGKTFVNFRMEEEEVGQDMVEATSLCRSFYAGGKFKISKHESSSEKGEYLITHITHNATRKSYLAGDEDSDQYQNTFMCTPANVAFRPARHTTKPSIFGTQTATVVGPQGQEIYTDSDGYGRVKVQFHWDRRGKKDENSSCWVRVAQSMAGRKWGELYLPRIGQEVVVSFLEGDPDRPLIIGAVYNAYNMPPIPLPDYKTMSCLKTNSSKGGGGFNALRFDDKIGEEQIFLQAEKDQDLRIKNDRFEWIGQDRHLIVQRDKHEHVKKNRHEYTENNHLEHIGKNRNLKVVGNEAVEIEGNRSVTVQGDVIQAYNANHTEQTNSAYYLKAKNIVIEADAGLTLKCAGGSVVIDPSGVTITGGIVTIDGGLVKIASGPGSPAAAGVRGSSPHPEAPTKAIEADNWEPGQGRRNS